MRTEDNRIYFGTAIRRTITSYEDDFGELHVGQFICKYGRSTGYHCDVIHALNESINRVAMDGEECDGGDSGAPWFHANRAYGVHEGEATVDGEKRDIWSAVAFLEDSIDVTVLMN